jgi:mono/diheme cytochrome c family protein
VLVYVKSASLAPATGRLYLLPGRTEEGQRLFVEKGCRDCHGVAGTRGGGPDLAGRRMPRSLIRFAAVMWNKAPAMLAAMKARPITVPQLGADEMADLVAYLDAVQHFASPGDPRQGRRVLDDKGCLECHSVRGRRQTELLDLAQVKGLDSPATVISALWGHSFLTERGGRPSGGWPQLRPKEMADLMAFLGSLTLPWPPQSRGRSFGGSCLGPGMAEAGGQCGDR